MIKSLILKSGYKHIFKKLPRKTNVSFEFNKLNVIIGPNACGKTSLLRLLKNGCDNSNHNEKLITGTSLREDRSTICVDKLTKAYCYNPNEFSQDQALSVCETFDDFAGFWNYHHMLSGAEKRAKYYSYFLSRHGQLKEEESAVLFDEPENSNSMDTLGAFLVGMERVFLSLPNIQVFVATHSLYLIMHLLEKRAKLIELEPNYLKSQVNMYKDIVNMYEKRN